MCKEIPFIVFYYHSKSVPNFCFTQKSKWLLNIPVYSNFFLHSITFSFTELGLILVFNTVEDMFLFQTWLQYCRVTQRSFWHREAFDTGTAWANQGWCTAGSAFPKPGWPWQPWQQWPDGEVVKNVREMTKMSSTAHKSGLWKRCYWKQRHLWLSSKVLIESTAK